MSLPLPLSLSFSSSLTPSSFPYAISWKEQKQHLTESVVVVGEDEEREEKGKCKHAECRRKKRSLVVNLTHETTGTDVASTHEFRSSMFEKISNWLNSWIRIILGRLSWEKNDDYRFEWIDKFSCQLSRFISEQDEIILHI